MYSGLGNRLLTDLANKLFERIAQLSTGALNGEAWYSVITSTAHDLSLANAEDCKFIFRQWVHGMISEDRHRIEIEAALVQAGSRECLDVFRGIGSLVVTGFNDDHCIQLQQGATWAAGLTRNFNQESLDVIAWIFFNRKLDRMSLSRQYLLKFAHALAMVPLVSGEQCAVYLEEAVDAYVIARAVLRDGSLLVNMCSEYVSLLLQLHHISSSSPS